MTTTIEAISDDVYENAITLIASQMARNEGYTFSALREKFDDTGEVGPCKEDYTDPAADLIDAIQRAPIALDQLAAIFAGLDIDA